MRLRDTYVAGDRRFFERLSSTGSCRIKLAGWLTGIAALATATAAIAAQPHIPADDNKVLETLPRDLLSSQDELASLRQQLANDSNNVELAIQLTSRYLQLGKSASDPRFYGYAQAAIHPWWEAASPPPEILRLRAKLKERDHRYDEALADLELLLDKIPRDLQAWIEVANIYGVQGKYAKARQACDELSEFAGAAATTICSAPILAVTGRAEEAYASLTDVLPTVREQWPAALQWVRTMQAEIARSLGRDAQAEQHYRECLVNDAADYYVLRSYGDLLLDQERDEEVLSLLREHISDTGILLRAAIAARRCGQEALAAEWQTQLKSRFEEARLRGSPPHGQFEARFELELRNDPQRALELAQANWRQQKELRDTRVLLEAAISAKDPAAAQPVLEFLKKNRTQDVVLERLVQQLERK